ncbi:alternate-type signal peptide domain-containing protein [Microbacterium sp. NPDC055665]
MGKGLVVAGVGLVLVAGGAGSLALWNDSATVAAGPVDSGAMTIAAVGGSWDTDITLWVPGNTATYTAELTVTLAGDDLDTELTLDPDSITGDPELLAALDIALATGAVTGGGTATLIAPNTYSVVSDTPDTEVTLTIPVTVEVDFPADSVTDTVAQNQAVDLGSIAFVLQQVAP